MTPPKTMMAVAVERTTAGPKLYLKETLVPHPGPGQILIRIKGAGVNRADLLQVEGTIRRRPARRRCRAWRLRARLLPSIKP